MTPRAKVFRILSVASLGILLMVGCVGDPARVDLPIEHPADHRAQEVEFWGVTSPFPVISDPLENPSSDPGADHSEGPAHGHGHPSGHSGHSSDQSMPEQKKDHSHPTEHGK
jgi:hypothetical protein